MPTAERLALDGLERIANMDYRGPRPQEQTAARAVLEQIRAEREAGGGACCSDAATGHQDRRRLLSELRSAGLGPTDVQLTESGHDFIVALDLMRRLVAEWSVNA